MDSELSFFLFLIVCLFVSAFFSALETALTTLSAARTKRLMEEKPYSARALGLWLKHPNHVLTSILIGNNIVNTLAASMATVIAQKMFANYAISLATFVITVLLLIFGEITPKTFSRHNAEKFAPVGMVVLVPFYILIMPLTLAMSLFAARLVKLVGAKTGTFGPLATEEDIAYMIRLGHEEGVLKRGEGQLLQSVIEFKETVAKEAMVTRTQICSFEVDTSYHEVMERVINEGHTRWPVYQKNIDNIVGIFHAKDLLHCRNPDAIDKPFSLRDFLRPAKFVPDMMKIGGLLKEFQAGKAHLAIVVDEYGGTAGIISLEDVLEEIVGEIRDEYDDEEREVTQIDANNYLANGRANLFELGKILEVNFPESEAYDSLGGFLIATYGRMPRVGAKINFGELTFLIKAADEKKIIQVHILQANNRPKLVSHSDDSSEGERAAA